MTVRAWVGGVLVGVVLAGAGPAAGQDGRRALGHELASLMLQDAARRAIEDQVAANLIQGLAVTVQERLNRRLADVEWQMLARIVRDFVGETLPPGRVDEIAAGVYARHFDERELRALVEFQRSPVARKLAQLGPVVAADTAVAIEREIRGSPAIPRTLEELRRAFPVLPQSP